MGRPAEPPRSDSRRGRPLCPPHHRHRHLVDAAGTRRRGQHVRTRHPATPLIRHCHCGSLAARSRSTCRAVGIPPCYSCWYKPCSTDPFSQCRATVACGDDPPRFPQAVVPELQPEYHRWRLSDGASTLLYWTSKARPFPASGSCRCKHSPGPLSLARASPPAPPATLLLLARLAASAPLFSCCTVRTQ